MLAAEGLVVLLPNRGARAARLTQKDVKELFEVCEALEAIAGELACPRISDEQLREIGALQASMVEHYREGVAALPFGRLLCWSAQISR